LQVADSRTVNGQFTSQSPKKYEATFSSVLENASQDFYNRFMRVFQLHLPCCLALLLACFVAACAQSEAESTIPTTVEDSGTDATTDASIDVAQDTSEDTTEEAVEEEDTGKPDTGKKDSGKDTGVDTGTEEEDSDVPDGSIPCGSSFCKKSVPCVISAVTIPQTGCCTAESTCGAKLGQLSVGCIPADSIKGLAAEAGIPITCTF